MSVQNPCLILYSSSLHVLIKELAPSLTVVTLISQLIPVDLWRTGRYGYSFGCVCRVLVQRAEEVVREGEQLSMKLK